MSIQINEVKDLMSQFDGSSLREFSYATSEFNLSFSKNNGVPVAPLAPSVPVVAAEVSHTVSDTTPAVAAKQHQAKLLALLRVRSLQVHS